MSEYRVVDYSFESLAGLPGEEPESLAYMVGLVDKPDHKDIESVACETNSVIHFRCRRAGPRRYLFGV